MYRDNKNVLKYYYKIKYVTTTGLITINLFNKVDI